MSSVLRAPSKTRTLYIAGHTGLVGSGLQRHFGNREDFRLLTAARTQLDLTHPAPVEEFLKREEPDVVIAAAGRVGGIQANSQQAAEFIYENLMMEANLIHGAWKAGVKRLLNFGSSCMYPRECPQPMRPEYLMTGKLEPTSEPYAMAKWAGLSLCSAYNRQYGTRYVTAIPCTVYGPGDNFNPEDGHVLSALLWRFYRAKHEGRQSVTLWGTGQPRREFIYVDDLAEACELLLETYEKNEPINIGSSEAVSIRDLAGLAAEVIGFRGKVEWDASKPDGAAHKQVDSSAIRSLGWKPRTKLRDGLLRTYHWFLQSSISFGTAALQQQGHNSGGAG